MQEKRVVVTGMGTVNPLGNSVKGTWAAILARKSGISGITRFDASKLACQIAGEVKNFDFADYYPEEMRKNAKRMDLFCHYAAAAMKEAADHAGLQSIADRNRIGISVGSGIGGHNVQHENSVALATKGDRRVSPFYIPMSIGNMASGSLSMMYGITGPNISIQTACATANHSVAMAQLIIRAGMADVMVAGGAEGTVNELAMAAFGNMRALSTRNDSPETASRPYDVDRDGFVMGEGAAILILEEYEHAKKRGADIVCEVLSCGMSGDAYDFVAPDPEGKGARYAMRMALDQAHLNPGDIGYINAHGTSTPVGDIAELQGIYELIKNTNEATHVGSTKSYHGHLLGATAGLEAIITIMAMKESLVPANINIFNRDPALPPVQLPTEPVKKTIKAALSNSFGFGGHNSSLILGAM
ncbi:MAG: beta-ketoacyl-[acyl-carrier-protein] synthase II [Treponema sp. RIFOXYC1_FULL_61_9]|nr:MAG: beta-ketoacyl-[acyl-carrier-protein] synthase II [Treponema sp. RIFOXYC1_FULL_61_9]